MSNTLVYPQAELTLSPSRLSVLKVVFLVVRPDLTSHDCGLLCLVDWLLGLLLFSVFDFAFSCCEGDELGARCNTNDTRSPLFLSSLRPFPHPPPALPLSTWIRVFGTVSLYFGPSVHLCRYHENYNPYHNGNLHASAFRRARHTASPSAPEL